MKRRCDTSRDVDRSRGDCQVKRREGHWKLVRCNRGRTAREKGGREGREARMRGDSDAGGMCVPVGGWLWLGVRAWCGACEG